MERHSGSADSIWAIDAIHPVYQDHQCNENLSMLRMVHHTDDRPGGFRYFLSDTSFVQKTPTHQGQAKNDLLDFGQSFSFESGAVHELVETIRLGDFDRRVPIIRTDRARNVLKREIETEGVLEKEIREYLTTAPTALSSMQKVTYERKIPLGLRPPIATIAVFNVGQGDTILIEYENGEIWLVDAYFWHEARYRAFEAWMDSRYTHPRIDRLIVSHFHYDHIRSAKRIINQYRPSEVLVPSSLIHKTATTRNLLRLCHRLGILRSVNQKEEFIPGLNIESEINVIITPSAELDARACALTNDPNWHELVVSLETDSSVALLSGDTPASLLKLAVNDPPHVEKAAFYKVTHHCSDTGNDPAFFNKFPFIHAATSCSISNRYGHPHRPPEPIIIGQCAHPGSYSRTFEQNAPIEWNLY